jgi:hypothetical protein
MKTRIRLYYHKTDGGAEYLFDTFIPWKHNGKSGKEGRITSDTKICVRLDGQPEIYGPIVSERAELLDALKKATRELEWLDRNALIKSRAGGDYIEVEHLPKFRALIASIEGV